MKKNNYRLITALKAGILAVILLGGSFFIYTALTARDADSGESALQSYDLNKTSRFLAGLLSPDELGFLTEKDRVRYKKTADSITRGWNGFFTKNKNEIIAWRDVNIQEKNISRVFYPFSGPDILHPLVFFPMAEDIIMFGLEPTGGIPSMKAVPHSALVSQSESLLDSLNFVLNHSFFVTSEMSSKVKRSSLNGVGALICFFLTRDGYTVLDAREIVILPDGVVSYDVKKAVRGKELVSGIEVNFTGADQKRRRARYFQIDISDKSLQLPRFFSMVDKFSPQASIVKSASFLMSNSYFSKIRNLILAKSPMIIQDDSGIPYRYIKKSEWDISYFGKYHKPIPAFAEQYQKSLETDVRKFSTGPIKFVYGYGYGYTDITYHIIVARKKQK